MESDKKFKKLIKNTGYTWIQVDIDHVAETPFLLQYKFEQQQGKISYMSFFFKARKGRG